MGLTVFELATFVVYLLAVALIGFVSGRNSRRSTSDFFLAGRGLPWYVIGFSLIAASISSEQFIGEVGWGYKYGLAVANWEWLVWPAQGLLLFFFLPVYLRNRIFTIPEYLTRRFGRVTGTVFSCVCMIQYLVINLPLVLYSGGFLIKRIFGLDLRLAIWLLVIVAGSYTIFGGLSSAAWVDLFNGALLVVGGLLVFGLGLATVPGGLKAVVGTGARAHLMLPASHPDLPWTGILAVAVVPVGLRGFIFAVLFGAIISTVDSLVNSTSTLLTLDIYKGLVRKAASERSLVRFAQWTGSLLLIFGALWAPMVGKFGSIFAYAQDSWALMLAPVMASFLLAIFWKRMTTGAALAALLLAFPMLVLVYFRQFYGVLSGINIFNLSGIIFLVSIILIGMISLLTKPPALENIRPMLWRRGLIALPVAETKDGYPWWKRISFWFGAVAAVFIIIYVIFW